MVRFVTPAFIAIRLGAAIAIVAWAFVRFYDYRCMVPWQGGASNEPAMFIFATLAFLAGFVWITAEVVFLVARRAGWPTTVAATAGIAAGLLLYAGIAGIVYGLDPSDRYYGRAYYRDRLSLSWVPGILEEFEHYDLPECGY